jgi:hypothetical protein
MTCKSLIRRVFSWWAVQGSNLRPLPCEGVSARLVAGSSEGRGSRRRRLAAPVLHQSVHQAWALVLAAPLTACGGGDVIPPAQAQAAPEPANHHLHAIVRPDAAGRWYVQADVDHAPSGISPTVEQGRDERGPFVRVFFSRSYSHAGIVHISSDDDFGAAGITGHSNLGLNNATIRIHAKGRLIDPATVWDHLPSGAGNLWVSVTMMQR